jgi:hypothetical protein
MHAIGTSLPTGAVEDQTQRLRNKTSYLLVFLQINTEYGTEVARVRDRNPGNRCLAGA